MDLSAHVLYGTKSMADNSSLFKTHRLNVMHAPVKFHKYMPYGLRVMARTRIGTDGRMYGTDGQG